MLIRAQNKYSLIELTNINIEVRKYITYGKNRHAYYNVECPNGVLGEYSSKEKAFKVLDMIEKEYLEPVYINDLGGGEYAKYEHQIFHMPEDSEV